MKQTWHPSEKGYTTTLGGMRTTVFWRAGLWSYVRDGVFGGEAKYPSVFDAIDAVERMAMDEACRDRVVDEPPHQRNHRSEPRPRPRPQPPPRPQPRPRPPSPTDLPAWARTLGVYPPFTLDGVRTQWRRLAQVHHPDRGGRVEYMQQINAAYEEAQRSLAS